MRAFILPTCGEDKTETYWKKKNTDFRNHFYKNEIQSTDKPGFEMQNFKLVKIVTCMLKFNYYATSK